MCSLFKALGSLFIDKIRSEIGSCFVFLCLLRGELYLLFTSKLANQNVGKALFSVWYRLTSQRVKMSTDNLLLGEGGGGEGWHPTLNDTE